jgi:hypothetical protein
MACIATYPPLGQVTLLKDPTVAIHAVFEVPPELASEAWELCLWYSNGDGREWAATEFTPDTPDVRPTDFHKANRTRTRLYFTAKLAVDSFLVFTVKYRQRAGEHEWCWVRNEQGSDDGIVVVEQKPTREGDPEDLPDLIQDLNPNLKWHSHMSQSPGTRLWSIEARVDAAKEDESAVVDIPLGIPWGRFGRFLRYGLTNVEQCSRLPSGSSPSVVRACQY